MRRWRYLSVIVAAVAASAWNVAHVVTAADATSAETSGDSQTAESRAPSPSEVDGKESALLRPSIQSNESSAIGWLRTIVGAETAHHAAYGYYASLTMLVEDKPPFLDGEVHQGRLQNGGYIFTVYAAGDDFVAIAVPVEMGTTGTRCFYVDASGVIRHSPGEEGLNDEAPPLGS